MELGIQEGGCLTDLIERPVGGIEPAAVHRTVGCGRD